MLPDQVTLIGIRFDAYSSFLRGPADAPPLIREALYSDSANLTTETGVDLAGHPMLADAGDRVIAEDQEGYFSIEHHLSELLASPARPLTLGGDHAITYPIMRAMADVHGPLTLLHIDAHGDLYDEFEGNRYSHACPFARIMEEGLAKRLIQVGIRTMTAHQREQAERFGVEVHEMRSFQLDSFRWDVEGPAYLSLDLDALDPAFAPGVSHHEPGGFSVRDVISLIHHIDTSLAGADIVEYNPARDLNGQTAMVAAKLTKEVLGMMLTGR